MRKLTQEPKEEVTYLQKQGRVVSSVVRPLRPGIQPKVLNILRLGLIFPCNKNLNSCIDGLNAPGFCTPGVQGGEHVGENLTVFRRSEPTA